MVGLANGGKRARVLVGLANMQSKAKTFCRFGERRQMRAGFGWFSGHAKQSERIAR